jgi:PDZ domain
VLVRRVAPTSPASAVLHKHDVILSADGIHVAGDGTVAYRASERISWVHIVKQKHVGDVVTLEILRNGELLTLQVPLSVPATSNSLIPPHLNNQDPSYFVYGGLVFLACSVPYLKWVYGSGSEFRSRTPVSLLQKVLQGQRQSLDEQVVVLSQVLACEGTSGYESVGSDLEVKSFNGIAIRNLRQLAQLVLGNKEPMLQIELESNHLVVLDTATAVQDTALVMRTHSIGSSMSSDIRDSIEQQQP